MSRSLALLVNVHSRRARQNAECISHLEKAFGDRGPFIASKSPSELPVRLSDVRRADPVVIFICGGDGTLRQTLTHLLASYAPDPLPKIAVLRGGTMNTVATSLEIYRTPEEHLTYLLSRYD